MTRAICILTLLVAVPAGAADSLSDLRAALTRLNAASPFSASASVDVSGDSLGVAGSRNGASTFEVTSSPEGLVVRVAASELATAAREARAKKRDAETKTPTRTAMAALTVFDVIQPVDAAAMLLDDLDGATVVSQTASSWQGRPATLLRIAVKPTLAGTTSRFVNKPKIELRLWLDANGIPVGGERDSNYSATFVVVSASNSRLERWDFAVAGDRLYIAHSEELDRASAVGRNIVTKRTITLTPHTKR